MGMCASMDKKITESKIDLILDDGAQEFYEDEPSIIRNTTTWEKNKSAIKATQERSP